ncbi:MAG: YkgJ family cysteine cluster protein [Sedimentisphaerales bacterium]|nr:YkgJ family cysteine cluster protein [Sedimentisphaerales bacterium]
MKAKFHPQITEIQQYNCIRCGGCCRGFLVAVRADERRAIEDLADWRSRLDVADLWVSHRGSGGSYALAKRSDGSCVFLDRNNLCLIHKEFGAEAKPLACQLYPFVITPIGDEIRIGLRFDCPAVEQNEPGHLKGYQGEIRKITDKLVPEGVRDVVLPRISRRQEGSLSQLDTITQSLINLASGGDSLNEQLRAIDIFVRQLPMVRWSRLSESDVGDFVNMLQIGALGEAQRPISSDAGDISKCRKLLGQFFFLLCQGNSAFQELSSSFGARLRNRMQQTRDMKQLGLTSGALPAIRPDWPKCDIAEVESLNVPWPGDVQDFFARYLTCRFAGFNHCGANLYNYSIVEGVRTILLSVVTAGFVMRISAIKDSRDFVQLSDAHYALRTIDGNLGYASALAMGPARLRLNHLSEFMAGLIDRYCPA